MTKIHNKFSAMKKHFQIIKSTVNVSNSTFDKKSVTLINYEVNPSHPTRFSFYDPNDSKALQIPPTRTVQMSIDSFETESEVSGIMTPTVFTHLLCGPPVLSRVSKEKLEM